MTDTKQAPLLERFFTVPLAGKDPFDAITWAKRDARITDAAGNVFFEQKDMDFPESWSQQAVQIVASKYFKGPMESPRREKSVRQLISRVVETVTQAGIDQGLFTGPGTGQGEARVFHDELTYLLVNQMACFNSPVWFNVGVTDEVSSGWCWQKGFEGRDGHQYNEGPRPVESGEHKPQTSACFIVAPEDNMNSILDWVKTEGKIFKGGSGAGANVSKLRSSKELLTSGGRPSGPLPFMQINDTAAGSIRSGGKHRRAAKMVELNSDHPDIFEFVESKAKEERKISKLIAAGLKNDYNDPEGAQAAAFFQNENHSVSADDKFMEAVKNDQEYCTYAVTNGRIVEKFKARKLMHAIAEATHQCGDPGMQFRGTMNKWHTCPKSAPIRGSNPCSEYMFIDDSSCNLASLNLMQFRHENGRFDVCSFEHAVNIMILAQEILVDMGSYPTEAICQNSHDFRPLGLGYANLGAYAMSLGLPYDSDGVRTLAASITAIMTGQAYCTSAKIAEQVGAFPAFPENRDSMLAVLAMHETAAHQLPHNSLKSDAISAWDKARRAVAEHGARNAQTTVLAPTGTIGFMMDVDTTGIEPELSLIKYKYLVGGGVIKIVNQTVESAIRKLGGDPVPVLKYIEERGHVEGIVGPDDLAVFDCALPSGPSKRSIHYTGHLRMMAAVQPFLSGAISKTINMPDTATVEDIEAAYMQAWTTGLKAVAIYRDGSKNVQPLQTKKAEKESSQAVRPAANPITVDFAEIEAKVCAIIRELAKLPAAERRECIRKEYAHMFGNVDPVALLDSGCHRKLTGDRMAIVHEFKINGHKGYLTVGLYPDGTPAEIFMDMAKEGSTISGLLDTVAISTSFNLQHGVPLRKLVDKFAHSKFEPAGMTDNPDIRFCDSVIDYVFRYLELKFLKPKEQQEQNSLVTDQAPAIGDQTPNAPTKNDDAPCCLECGNVMVRNGSCFKCLNCGGTSGCS